jgi:hypothetical protein
MKLQELYAFSEVAYKDGILVSNGREKSTGRPVQVHLFPSSRTKDAMELCQRVMSLPEEERSRVLQAGQGEGGGYFVTEPLPDGLGLEKWLAAAKAAPKDLPEVRSETAGQLRQMGLYPAALAPIIPGPELQRRAETVSALPSAPVPTTAPAASSTPAPSPASAPPPAPSGATQFLSHLYGGGIASTTPSAPAAPASAPVSIPPVPSAQARPAVEPTPVAAPAASRPSPGPLDILESIYGKGASQTAPEASGLSSTLRSEPVQEAVFPAASEAPSTSPGPSAATQFLNSMFRSGPDSGFDDSTHAGTGSGTPVPPPIPTRQEQPKPPAEIDIMERVYGSQPVPTRPAFAPEPVMPVVDPPVSQGKGTGLETFLFGKSAIQDSVRLAVVPVPPSPVAQTPAAPFFAPEPPARTGSGSLPAVASPFASAPKPVAPEPLWSAPEPAPATTNSWGGSVTPAPVFAQSVPAKPDAEAAPRPTPSSRLRSGSKVPGTLDLKTMLIIVAVLLVVVALVVGVIEFLG